MKEIIIILSILFIHFVADFILQSDKQAKGKSTSNKHLTLHVLSYSFVWLLVANVYSIVTNNYQMVALFPIITFICHWITDYFTSRINAKLWAKGDVHNFFVGIGADQYLHQLQLILTYYFLTK